MNKAVLLLLATTAITSIACMHLVRALRTEEARGDALQARIAELEHTVAQQSARPTPFSSVVSAPAGVEPTTQRMQTVAPSPATDQSRNPGALPPGRGDQIRHHFSRQRKMLQDPEYREAMRVQHRLGAESSYPNLAAELGLSQQEADQLFDLLAEHQIRGMEQHEVAFLPGERPDEASMREAQQLAQQRYRQEQTELETLLGLNKYQKWQEYQQTLGQRHRVASIQSSLAMAGTPLNAEQSDALLSALVDEQHTQQANALARGATAVGAFVMDGAMLSASPAGLSSLEEHLKTRERSQKRLLTSLQSIWTAQQMEHLQETFEREIEMQRAHMKMQRAQGDDQSNGIIGSNTIIFSGQPAGFVEFSPGGFVRVSEEAVDE